MDWRKEDKKGLIEEDKKWKMENVGRWTMENYSGRGWRGMDEEGGENRSGGERRGD
jgi:hypothetical protein